MQTLPPLVRVREKTGVFLSVKKLLNFFPSLIIFFSATQLGLHFWPSSALVSGIRIDYLSPTLYFLDILILLHLCNYAFVHSKLSTFNFQLSTIFPLLLTNLLFSANPLASLSWTFHLFLYLLFLFSLSPTIIHNLIFKILPLSLLFQLLLSLIQVSLGHTLQGFMYYFGERMVSVGSPSVAVGSFMGQVVLRAYGTFGHPNVLAGFSVISLLIILKLGNWYPHPKTSSKLSISKLSTFNFQLLTVVSLVLLTQSRAAALSLFGLVIPFYLLKSLKTRLMYFSLLLIASCYFLIPSGLATRDLDLSLSQRLTLTSTSLLSLSQLPIFGTGANASISTYPTLLSNPRLLQPDHNSFTLFFSWFGLFGALAFIYFCNNSFKAINWSIGKLVYFVLPLLPLLLLDHYLLTSPQGLFILMLYLKVLNLDKLDIK